MSKQILEALFDSKTKVKLLKFMFRNAGNFFTLEDIVNHTREKKSEVVEQLDKLERIGLIKKSRMRPVKKDDQNSQNQAPLLELI